MPKGDGDRAWFNRVIQGEWEDIELQTLVSCETQRSQSPTTQEMTFASDVEEFAKLVGNSPEGTRIWMEWRP
jgi:hypothetical protein